MGSDAKSTRRGVEAALKRRGLRQGVAQRWEELERFAAVLVHDLSAPIASLQIYARLIEEDLNGENVDMSEIVGHCRHVVGMAQRVGALIDTLHEYTKATAQVAFEPVEMCQVMEDTLSNLKHVTRDSGARVTYGKLPIVIGNAPQLTQLLQNLIGNAIKYCEATPPVVHVAASPAGENSWQFAVKDNGIGIPEEHWQQVFEPFKRLPGTGKYEGSGLGLATCKKIVERHGGVIRCKSKPGEGTILLFTLRSAFR